MKTALSTCPVCDADLTVTRLHCETCETVVEGRFSVGAFGGLSQEQLDFVETFVRCEGKINRMQDEMALSYPTIRTRLHEVIRALGYEPGKETDEVSDEKRKSILNELDSGKISADEAMKLLNGEE